MAELAPTFEEYQTGRSAARAVGAEIAAMWARTRVEERPGVDIEKHFPGNTRRNGKVRKAAGSVQNAAKKIHIDAGLIRIGDRAVGVGTLIDEFVAPVDPDWYINKRDAGELTRTDIKRNHRQTHPPSQNAAYWVDYEFEKTLGGEGLDELHGLIGELLVARATPYGYVWSLQSDDVNDPSRGLKTALYDSGAEPNEFAAATDLEAINVPELNTVLYDNVYTKLLTD